MSEHNDKEKKNKKLRYPKNDSKESKKKVKKKKKIHKYDKRNWNDYLEEISTYENNNNDKDKMKNSEFKKLESQQNHIYNLKGQKFNKEEVNNNKEKAIIINNESNILEIKDSTLDIELEDKKDDLFNYMNNQANLTLDTESDKGNVKDEIHLVEKDNEEKKRLYI